jgi:hypothetical protein
MNHKFHRLTILKFEFIKNGRSYYSVECDCGNIKIIRKDHINITKSCGCLQIEVQTKRCTKHLKCGTKVYRTWSNMIQRCTNKNNKFYYLYGGRGIKVCDKWLNDFESFFNYIGDPPTSKHTIDRINNNGNYEPGNVRWATRKQQTANRRNSKYVS